MMRRGVATTLLLVMGICPPAGAATVRVPSDFATLRAATAAAASGDTISIAPGTYVDRFTVIGKTLVIRGEMGADQTILDGSLAVGNVVTVQGVGRDFIIEDLTITGGSFNPVAQESLGAAIYVNQAHPTIQRCRLVDNHANVGGGVAAYFFSRPLIRDCWIAHNTGGGIFLETGDGLEGGDRAEFINNFVVENQGFGISVIKGAKAIIEACTIAFNSGDGVRTEQGDARIQVVRSIVAFNGGAGIRRRDVSACLELSCNNVYQNTDGAWVGTNPNDPCFRGRGLGSVSLDPLFVNPAAADYHLDVASPLFQLCTAGGCGALGAETECPTAVENTSWGRVKNAYRDD